MTSRKKRQQKTSKVPFYVGGGILVLLVVAVITVNVDGGNDDNGGSTAQEYADVSVSGGSLPEYSQETADGAVGLPMPQITGESFDGTSVSISNDGRAKVILYLAHW